jgi:hypothetical protein
MRFLKAIFGRSQPEQEPEPTKQEKYHCIRFMTERGEQLGMLLSHTEFETAVNRWVQNVSVMPNSEEVDDEGVI